MTFNMVSLLSKKVGMRIMSPDLATTQPVITLSEDSAVDPVII
ncbi:MAG: hypothetical protein U0263_12735 [Polyangiaceae bacterium]